MIYYNDNDPYCAEWLRNLIAAGLISPGDVDERSITDVKADDLKGYTQIHFFAGIGGWPLALQLAGWPDSQPIWTASCPCPPFSVAGKSQACPVCQDKMLVWCPRRTGYAICSACGHAWFADERHLWPEVWRLAAERRPQRIFGEQVTSIGGIDWLAGVRGSLEILGYAVGAFDLPAAGVGAPHIRQRLWWFGGLGDTRRRKQGQRCNADQVFVERNGEEESASQISGSGGSIGVGDADGSGHAFGIRHAGDDEAALGQTCGEVIKQASTSRGFWSDYDIIPCGPGKARRVKSGLFVLAHGVSNRVGRLRAYGNSICPQIAAEFIQAVMEIER